MSDDVLDTMTKDGRLSGSPWVYGFCAHLPQKKKVEPEDRTGCAAESSSVAWLTAWRPNALAGWLAGWLSVGRVPYR